MQNGRTVAHDFLIAYIQF